LASLIVSPWEIAAGIGGSLGLAGEILIEYLVGYIHCRSMKTAVQKWGNSLALRIPKAYAEETDIHDGSSVELSLKSGSLVIRPIRRKAFKLDALVKGVNSRNRHASVATGAAVGQEVW